MATWNVATAKQRLSEVIHLAEREPQVIKNRDRPVAAVVSAADLDQYLAWKAERTRATLAESLADARRICKEEALDLTSPRREDRPNPFVPRRARGGR